MSVQERLNRYWDGRAVPYARAQDRPERRDADARAWSAVFATALAPLGPGPHDVLDVGTGSGFAARVLARAGHRVTGLDLSEGMLAQARALSAAEPHAPRYRTGDAVDPDVAPGSFDAVVNRYVAWTLHDPARAVANWWRALRPGGVVAVVDAPWFPGGLHAGATEQFRAHYDETAARALPLAEVDPVAGITDLLRRSGFVDVDVEALHEVHAVDLAHGAAPGHVPVLQHVVTARRPA